MTLEFFFKMAVMDVHWKSDSPRTRLLSGIKQNLANFEKVVESTPPLRGIKAIYLPWRAPKISSNNAVDKTGVGRVSRKVDIWKLIRSFLDVSLGHPLCPTPPRLRSGTSSVLLDSLDDALENPGVWPLSRRVEIWNFIRSFLNISLGRPLCSKPPRLLSGTSSVLLDSLDDALENPGVWPLSRRVEMWKLTRSFLYVS